MSIIIGLLIGGLFFLSNISSYILGLRHKNQIIQNIIPFTPLQVATKKVVDIIEQYKPKKEEEKETTVDQFGIRW